MQLQCEGFSPAHVPGKRWYLGAKKTDQIRTKLSEPPSTQSLAALHFQFWVKLRETLLRQHGPKTQRIQQVTLFFTLWYWGGENVVPSMWFQQRRQMRPRLAYHIPDTACSCFTQRYRGHIPLLCTNWAATCLLREKSCKHCPDYSDFGSVRTQRVAICNVICST